MGEGCGVLGEFLRGFWGGIGGFLKGFFEGGLGGFGRVYGGF